MFTIEDIHPFHQLIISVALGLLVGLQRQWAESSLAGVRTFPLITLLGTVCTLLAERFGGGILIVGFSGVIASMIVGNAFHESRKTPENRVGLSTEMAMLIMFGVGALVRSGPIWLAAASAGAVAVILQAKIELHEMASRFTGKELKAMMQFVLISLVIYPIIPNQTIDSLQVLNPREIWLMVILIVGLSLAGYIAYKFYGENAGTLLSGVLGGMISSTATTASYARAASTAGDSATLHSGIIIVIAWTIVYLRLFVEVVIVAPSFRTIWIPLGSLFFVSALSSIWLWREGSHAKAKMPQQENPSEVRTALIFGTIYSAILFGVAYAKQQWGAQGMMAMAVFSGVTDMDAITISTSQLVNTGKLSPQEGWPMIIAAATSNVFFKGLIAIGWGGRRLFMQVVLPWSLSLLCGLGLLFFWRPG